MNGSTSTTRTCDAAERSARLALQAISRFGLDLSGRCVYTEAASNAFAWTALIAAMTGAEVTAQTRDSRFGTADEVEADTLRLARTLGVADRIRVVRAPDRAALARADVVTNLGFVRPISADKVAWLKEGAVICLMWEPWEFRPEDLDLAACHARGIPLLGTNERDPQLRTFRSVGLLAVKLLLEQGLEILGCHVALLGKGHFADEARTCLESLGAQVTVADTPCALPCDDAGHAPLDAAICIEHMRHDLLLVGQGGVLDTSRPLPVGLTIVHICGLADPEAARAAGCAMHPECPAAPGVMSFTTAHLGPKPVIDLHAAGLRVGQAWLDNDPQTLSRLCLPL
ncbi:hypothetical protein [Nitratidesulfovibrio vulgaris]|uniref:hypothetical protein n=1 Tax=Nitratidesulfovibrio vulgaris TaxID=881 RepID=UPI0023009CA6|nr:hypothetical protein [Nitratidesulfovibrio vulgaris]WCB46378.1 hypothetical protein PH214_15250 [Nitratidesulfovibrio vulgaris]